MKLSEITPDDVLAGKCWVIEPGQADESDLRIREVTLFTSEDIGLFSAEPKTKDELCELYRWMVKEYPFVIIEDPLNEDDYEGTALLTRELGIQVVGDDLFTTNPERVQKGIEVGAANTVLLKVNQIGTISEALDMVQLAYRNGYGVMPCSSRGEGADIADVWLNRGDDILRQEVSNAVFSRDPRKAELVTEKVKEKVESLLGL